MIIGMFAVFFIANLVTFGIGYRRGIEVERERCLSICHDVWRQGSHSPTAGRIARSIDDGRSDLISEDKFYG